MNNPYTKDLYELRQRRRNPSWYAHPDAETPHHAEERRLREAAEAWDARQRERQVLGALRLQRQQATAQAAHRAVATALGSAVLPVTGKWVRKHLRRLSKEAEVLRAESARFNESARMGGRYARGAEATAQSAWAHVRHIDWFCGQLGGLMAVPAGGTIELPLWQVSLLQMPARDLSAELHRMGVT